MALFEKQNPVGIDKQIQKLQNQIYTGLGFTNFDGYGRAYLLKNTEDKVVPHHYVAGSNGEYQEILYNDEINGHFFFLDSSETKPFSGVHVETEVSIYFFLNLEKLKPSITHKADEEIREQIMGILERFRYFQFTNMVKGEDALNDFETDLEAIHPRFFLKITGNLRYQFNC